MKKKIMAIVATIAAVFGFGFAANSAMAVDYGAVTVSGNVATVTINPGTFQPNEKFTVTFDDTYVSNVEQIAQKTWGPFTAAADGSANLKITLTDAGVKLAQEGKLAASFTGENGTTFALPVNAPATGAPSTNPSGTTGTTANTGAAIAPYAIAVALLAAAGVAIFSVRKVSRR
ncbi:hypothetical protein DSM100688_1110 [Bifidobacterium ramosum]|uniref:LPXTG cell wall anchor domain-containing protein n=1 Tax=Bifidobacterium ramosum TaxID=1798158 RepID=A0A6L4X196_9BIFI|nr:hypothetical protein [Bifidobacterium ramosum]KAB8288000.1 hypothetical protein DSM100688_1110 [Bifidobacterium ramosum]NEG72057.1 hypothetical protein [Bifidobacterium ramosum]